MKENCENVRKNIVIYYEKFFRIKSSPTLDSLLLLSIKETIS